MKIFYKKLRLRGLVAVLLLLLAAIPLTAQESVEELTISTLETDYLTAKVATTKPEKGKPQNVTQWQVGEIFNVFSSQELIDGQKHYIGFTDSVYLTRVKTGELYFQYLWQGERKFLKEGLLLYPTGRFYKTDNKEIRKITDKSEDSSRITTFAFVGPTLITTQLDEGDTYTGGMEANFLINWGRFLGLKAILASGQNISTDWILALGINTQLQLDLLDRTAIFYMGLGAGFSLLLAEAETSAFLDVGMIGIMPLNSEWYDTLVFDIFIRLSNANFSSMESENIYTTFGLKIGYRF